MKPAFWRNGAPASMRSGFLAALLPRGPWLAQTVRLSPVLLLTHAVLLADPARAQPAVTDPAAPVPPVVYKSVFADTPKGVETQSIDWKKANAEVGQFRRGHVDILKWEEANPSATPPSRPATPGGTTAAPAGAGMHKH